MGERCTPIRYVLVGDGESPHLLKWAHALLQEAPGVWPQGLELWLVSSRDCGPEWDALVPLQRRLCLHHPVRTGGGNASVLRHLPAVVRWLRSAAPQVVHAHYLTSHGTLAYLACRWWGVPGRLVCSAWGSDILLTPQRSRWHRAITRLVLQGSDLSTSDSQHMARRMRELGAGEVMVFPFGLMEMPPLAAGGRKHGVSAVREPWRFFSNRGLEPIYRIDRVIDCFAQVAQHQPQARLIIANRGSEEAALRAQVRQMGLTGVEFVGYLSAAEQSRHYAQAQWYFSLPESDSVSVSVLEALAHGCLPLLSDLPANRELVGPLAARGLVLGDAMQTDALQELLAQAGASARHNREWVQHHAWFPPQVGRFLRRVQDLQAKDAPERCAA